MCQSWTFDPDGIFYGRIDEDKIGIAGYSQGGAAAIRAVTEFENSNKYKAIFTGSASYALLAKNMGWEYDISKVAIPYFMTGGTGASDCIRTSLREWQKKGKRLQGRIETDIRGRCCIRLFIVYCGKEQNCANLDKMAKLLCGVVYH